MKGQSTEDTRQIASGSWQETDILYTEPLLNAASCQLQGGLWLLTLCSMPYADLPRNDLHFLYTRQ